MTDSSNAHSRFRRVAILVCGLGLAGCAGEGSKGGFLGVFKSDPKPVQTVAINHDDYGRLGYRIEWTGYSASEKGAAVTHADLLGDVISIVDTHSFLSLISTSSGANRWSTIAAEPLTAFVGSVRDGRRIICCTGYEALFFDVDTGALLDKQKFGRVVCTHPGKIGPYLLFGTRAGEVLAHLTANGIRAWGYGLNGPIETDPLVIDGDAVFVSQSGDVLVLDGQAGSAKGRAKMYAGAAGKPATSGDAVFVTSLDQSVYAFERYGGATRWRYRTDAALTRSPAYFDGRVYVDIPSKGLTALDARTGKPAWSAPDVHGQVIAVRGARLFVWDGSNAVMLEKDGQVAEKAVIPDVAAILTDKMVDGSIYVVRKGGSVSKFQPR